MIGGYTDSNTWEKELRKRKQLFFKRIRMELLLFWSDIEGCYFFHLRFARKKGKSEKRRKK